MSNAVETEQLLFAPHLDLAEAAPASPASSPAAGAGSAPLGAASAPNDAAPPHQSGVPPEVTADTAADADAASAAATAGSSAAQAPSGHGGRAAGDDSAAGRRGVTSFVTVRVRLQVCADRAFLTREARVAERPLVLPSTEMAPFCMPSTEKYRPLSAFNRKTVTAPCASTALESPPIYII